MAYSITRTTEVVATPAELAESFCEMDGEEQAAFFNKMAIIMKGWDSPYTSQLIEITAHLTNGGAEIMESLAEYSH